MAGQQTRGKSKTVEAQDLKKSLLGKRDGLGSKLEEGKPANHWRIATIRGEGELGGEEPDTRT